MERVNQAFIHIEEGIEDHREKVAELGRRIRFILEMQEILIQEAKRPLSIKRN